MNRQSSVSRRSFLKAVGAAGLGKSTLPAWMPSRALAVAGANRRLSLALIGCGGRMGEILGSALQQGDQVVAICDVDARQIAALRRSFAAPLERVKVYEDYRKLLDTEKSVDAAWPEGNAAASLSRAATAFSAASFWSVNLSTLLPLE